MSKTTYQVRECDIDDLWEINSSNGDCGCYDDDLDEADEFKRNTDACLNCPYHKMTVEIDDD